MSNILETGLCRLKEMVNDKGKIAKEWARPKREALTEKYLNVLKWGVNLEIEFNDINEAQSREYLKQTLDFLEEGGGVIIPLVPHRGTMDSLVLYWVINQYLKPFVHAIITSIKFEIQRAFSRANITENMGQVSNRGIGFFMRTLFNLNPRSIRYAVVQLYLIKTLVLSINKTRAEKFNDTKMRQLYRALSKGKLIVGFMPEATRDDRNMGLLRAVPNCFAISRAGDTRILPLVVDSTNFKSDKKIFSRSQKSTTRFSLAEPFTYKDAKEQVGHFYFTNKVVKYSTERNPVTEGEELNADDIVMRRIAQNMPNDDRGVYRKECIRRKSFDRERHPLVRDQSQHAPHSSDAETPTLQRSKPGHLSRVYPSSTACDQDIEGHQLKGVL
jgi:hypothetical protein